METYHKSMAGLERRRSRINLQFMLEMRKLEEDDESRFEEEYNVWLSDEPLTKGAWIRGNDGWIRSYRVPLWGATRLSLLHFHGPLRPSACRASPAVVPSN